ncbi:MAG: hypothetical protein OEW00_02865 [candidate division Zixibacteria bacterium]|nr:hypothetical protein [candidate division Zixibacteria bacterium]
MDRLPKRVLAELNLETVFKASRCVIAAERLLVFRKLYGRELSAADIARHTGIHGRHCESFLDSLACAPPLWIPNMAELTGSRPSCRQRKTLDYSARHWSRL